jgi:F-box/leucine-rich repeat protein 14
MNTLSCYPTLTTQSINDINNICESLEDLILGFLDVISIHNTKKTNKYRMNRKIVCDKRTEYKLCKVDDQKLNVFIRWFHKPPTILNLSMCPGITDAGVSLLKNTELESLNLCGKKITDTSLLHLKNIQTLNNLVLTGCVQITDCGVLTIQYLNLKTIVLTGCIQITDLYFISNNRNLIELDLSGTSITDYSLKYLNGLRIEKLILSDCQQISDAGLITISDLPLWYLDCNDCYEISDISMKYVSKLFKLTYLSLENCKISDSGIECIKKLSQLTHLNVSGCWRITDYSMECVNNFPQLTHLDVESCCKITNYGMSQINKLSKLKQLNVGYCWKITDDGLEHLNKLYHLSHLTLHDCVKITDIGINHLKYMNNLKFIDLQNCNITYKGTAILSKLHLSKLVLHRVEDNAFIFINKMKSTEVIIMNECSPIIYCNGYPMCSC